MAFYKQSHPFRLAQYVPFPAPALDAFDLWLFLG